jgi:superoxide dismutase, Cu-Zn family
MSRYFTMPVIIAALFAAPLQDAQAQGPAARADLVTSQGAAAGTITFVQKGDAVQVVADLQNLPPGEHSLHIHEKALCDRPKFESAGNHFNPGAKQHGFLNPQGPHAGDLPNITVNPDGKAHAEFTTRLITLQDGANNSLFKDTGTSVVIHSNRDDYVTDPAGGGGDRIACGAIVRTSR